jgi:hypothetical protein
MSSSSPAAKKRPRPADVSSTAATSSAAASSQPSPVALAPGATVAAAAATATDSWASFRDCLASLRAEVATLDAVIYKNHNQHRRTHYWQAMRRVHREAGRVAAAMRSVGERDFLQATTTAASVTTSSSSTAAAPAPPPSAVKLAAAQGICADAAACMLRQCRALTAQQTGGGFAALLAVLVGSCAQALYLTLRLRDALAAAAPQLQPALPAPAAPTKRKGAGAASASPSAAASTATSALQPPLAKRPRR